MEVQYLDNKKYRLKAKELRKECSTNLFKFNSTAEVTPLRGIIGQDRAVRSLDFGLNIDNPGYNIYLAGVFGTGKTTLAREMLEKKATREPVPSDWCYVHNFKKPDCPQALELPAGKGKEFKKDLELQVENSIAHISQAFEGEDFEYKKNQILTMFVEETNRMYIKADEEARTYGFTISRNQNGISSVPLKNGEALSQEEYRNMSEEERDELMKRSSLVQEKLNEAFRQYRELEKDIKAQIKELEQETARSVIAPNFNKLLKKYRTFGKLITYLEDIQQDLLENLELFTKPEEPSSFNLFRHVSRRSLERRYQVNLAIDNSGLKHAPVIFETNPTYSNLFGQIEYEGEFGILATDFTKIKAGSIHQANGGYLLLHVYDIVRNFYVWDSLKRVLKNQAINLESISRMMGISNTETLQPEPIPANIKVILIGEPIYYYLLYAYDEEFQKLFKIRADFDVEMERSRKHVSDYARLISSVCENEKLRHFTPGAVARVVDYGSRMADDRNKLTTLFNRLVEIIYEANSWAKRDGSELVEQQHVIKAIEEKKYRSSMLEERSLELIKQSILLINVDGWSIGEINGLAVYEVGDHTFGRPVRITAKTFMGEKGLVNIEREILMSGSIHSKGVLTLNGYMGAQYAQDKPLSLSASLTFEQSYQGIEGDSASSAELYALLSSLAEVPIYQGIAVTGSVNQNGEIQPVGGVNQKIEGFFKVCKERGLNGNQGVIIPKQNVEQLMLDSEVVEAVKNRMFNVWAVEHINEGLEILTGRIAGKQDEGGRFTSDSVHYLVNNKLSEWSYRRSSTVRLGLHPSRETQRIRRRRGK
jgi:lon-related putative ATP-dependent protease